MPEDQQLHRLEEGEGDGSSTRHRTGRLDHLGRSLLEKNDDGQDPEAPTERRPASFNISEKILTKGGDKGADGDEPDASRGIKRRSCFAICKAWLYSKFYVDPAVHAVSLKGVSDNPFAKELVVGETFKYGINGKKDDPTIKIEMKRVVNPWFRGFFAFLTCGLSEIYYRFMYVIFNSSTRLAMTNQGRILIWSFDVRGENVTVGQMLIRVFMTKSTAILMMLSVFVLGTGHAMGELFDFDTREYQLYMIGGSLIMMLLKFAQTMFHYAKRRLAVRSQTQMRSFQATDLCATSFILYHDHGLCGGHTSSEVRFYFGRFPEKKDLYFSGHNVAEMDLVETNPPVQAAGGDGKSSISEHDGEDTQVLRWVSMFETVKMPLDYVN